MWSLSQVRRHGFRASVATRERPIRVRDYLRSVRACKLHDVETGTWHRYPAR